MLQNKLCINNSTQYLGRVCSAVGIVLRVGLVLNLCINIVNSQYYVSCVTNKQIK